MAFPFLRIVIFSVCIFLLAGSYSAVASLVPAVWGDGDDATASAACAALDDPNGTISNTIYSYVQYGAAIKVNFPVFSRHSDGLNNTFLRLR